MSLHDAARKGLHVHAAEIASSAGKHAVYLLRRVGRDAIEIRLEAAVRAHFVAVSDTAQATLQILVALRQHSGLRICATAVQQIARQIGKLARELTGVGRVLLNLVESAGFGSGQSGIAKTLAELA